MQQMTLHGKLLERRYGLISGKEDIFYLEVDSLDNELLKYANEKIEV